MVTPSTILVFVHTATPGPSFLITCRAVLLPYSSVTPFDADFSFLSEGQISLEVSLHGLRSDFVLFLFDDSFISQSMYNRIDFFFRSSGIFKYIAEYC